MNTGSSGNLTVTLDGVAKLANIEGHYSLNGKQYWIQDQGSNAIWYDKKLKKWRIGDKKHNGTSTSSLYSTNDASGPENVTAWKYWNDYGGWKSTSNVFGSLSRHQFFQNISCQFLILFMENNEKSIIVYLVRNKPLFRNVSCSLINDTYLVPNKDLME